MKITQVKVENVGHPEYMVCWVPSPKKIRLGTTYVFKDVVGMWRVVEIYSTQSLHEISRGWNNNI